MKRASVAVPVYFRIFEIILLVMVAGIIATEVKNVQDSGIYQKKFLSRDFALVLDALTNARGNVWYLYAPSLTEPSRFAFSFLNGKVTVDDESWLFAQNTKSTYFFPPNSFKPSPDGLLVTKLDNEVVVQDYQRKPFPGLLLDCPGAQIKITKVILDPIPESEVTLKTAVALQSYLNLKGVQSIGTRVLKVEQVGVAEEAKTVAERIALIDQHKDAVIVSLHAGKADKSQNIIKAYVNANAPAASQQVACTVLNALVLKYPDSITGTAIIPVNPSQLSPADQRKILLENRIAVQFELGNLNLPENPLLTDPSSLAEVIAQGMIS